MKSRLAGKLQGREESRAAADLLDIERDELMDEKYSI